MIAGKIEIGPGPPCDFFLVVGLNQFEGVNFNSLLLGGLEDISCVPYVPCVKFGHWNIIYPSAGVCDNG